MARYVAAFLRPCQTSPTRALSHSIHREGQKKQCVSYPRARLLGALLTRFALPQVIYRFLTSGTMDEKIFQRQTTKLGLSGSLMVSAERAEDELKARLTSHVSHTGQRECWWRLQGRGRLHH